MTSTPAALKPSSRSDWWLLIITFILLLTGVIFVLDASVVEGFHQFDDKYHFAKNQLQWAAFGIATLLILARIPLSWIYKFAKPVFIISTILLVLVIIPGIGSRVQGARRWLTIGFIDVGTGDNLP